jgi:ABC-type Fe3+-siderophore transport system permease subunit
MRSGYSVRVEGVKYGASFGSALAMAVSYTNNHSIIWAIIHGILSWLYVIYFAIVHA